MIRREWRTPFKVCPSQVCLLILSCLPISCCIIQAQAYHISTLKGNICACLIPFLSCCVGAGFNRQAMRKRYMISGSLCNDIVLHLFCWGCAVVQEHTEANLLEDTLKKL